MASPNIEGTTNVDVVTGGSFGTKVGNSVTETVGFYGSTGSAKLTVTGSKGGNAALTSLIAQLVALGLITDSTS